jgi:hypothetical protein
LQKEKPKKEEKEGKKKGKKEQEDKEKPKKSEDSAKSDNTVIQTGSSHFFTHFYCRQRRPPIRQWR